MVSAFDPAPQRRGPIPRLFPEGKGIPGNLSMRFAKLGRNKRFSCDAGFSKPLLGISPSHVCFTLKSNGPALAVILS